MSRFSCPVCDTPLSGEATRYVCARGHSFDRSAAGYVNLLLSNQKHSSDPGDDKQMAAARARFLGKGYYHALQEALSTLCCSTQSRAPHLLDAGCGEGYYTIAAYEALRKAGLDARAVGIDISKSAVSLAARKHSAVEFAVASAYRLPVFSQSTDLLLCCFSPVAAEEFRRVLRPGGCLLLVQPAPSHLWGLKCALYENPYENDAPCDSLPGFWLRERLTVRDRLQIHSGEDIRDLFLMTPYAWRTSPLDAQRLANLQSLETELAFSLAVFKRTGTDA